MSLNCRSQKGSPMALFAPQSSGKPVQFCRCSPVMTTEERGGLRSLCISRRFLRSERRTSDPGAETAWTGLTSRHGSIGKRTADSVCLTARLLNCIDKTRTKSTKCREQPHLRSDRGGVLGCTPEAKAATPLRSPRRRRVADVLSDELSSRTSSGRSAAQAVLRQADKLEDLHMDPRKMDDYVSGRGQWSRFWRTPHARRRPAAS